MYIKAAAFLVTMLGHRVTLCNFSAHGILKNSLFKPFITAAVSTLVVSILLLSACNPHSDKEFSFNALQPSATLLSDEILLSLNTDSSISSLKEIFDNINIIRQVGTPKYDQVKTFIIKFLTRINMHIELDNFESQTPIGILNFTNIIGTVDPKRKQNLVLACHYESKRMPDFYGSTDSALPCSLILKVAETLSKSILLQKNMELGLQVIFFDGEEAFVQWTDNDSLYGSRHLAAKWSSELDENGKSKLSKVNLLVLLDLLGVSSPTIPDYGLESLQAYQTLVHLESRLRNLGLFKNRGQSTEKYFGHTSNNIIQDDHIPFVQRGVQVLHLIPTPFPPVWHTVLDNANFIDWDTCQNLLTILEAFVRTYMHIFM